MTVYHHDGMPSHVILKFSDKSRLETFRLYAATQRSPDIVQFTRICYSFADSKSN